MAKRISKKTEADLNYLVEKGRMPPAAIEIEMAVLGAMLIDPEAVAKAMEMLKAESFYVPKHRHIYAAIVQLFSTNSAIDSVTVYEEMKRMGVLDEVGGAVYLADLTENISSAANIEYHAKIIAEKSILRELITVSHSVASMAYDEADDAFKILDAAEKKIYEITEEHLRPTYKDMNLAVKQAMEYIEMLHMHDISQFAVPTGFIDLDELLGGFQRSDLIILAARPSMGKTALALSFARSAAVNHKVPVAIFSLEMATLQLTIRMLCAEARLDAHQVRTGKLPLDKQADLPKNATKLIRAPIYIDDAPMQSILEIRAKCRRLKKEKDIGLVVIDYLQLMQGPAGAESREREISHISQSLKSLAKELNIPVMALAQLNRAVESRNEKRPMLSDLRESGSIEQDADVVMFINRPEFYGMKTDKDGNSLEGIAEVLVAKHRNGPTGEVQLRFIKEYARFENKDNFSREAPQIGSGSGMSIDMPYHPIPEVDISKNEDVF